LTYSNNKSEPNSAKIILNGAATVTLAQGEPYTELGALADDAEVIISGGINTNQQGTYLITYLSADKENKISSITRTVIVKRSAKTNNAIDAIQLIGDATVVLVQGQPYEDLGATLGSLSIQAKETVDTNKTGIYTLVYTVPNNTSIKTRTVIVVLPSDSPKPIISLIKGDVELKQGDSYHDLGIYIGKDAYEDLNNLENYNDQGVIIEIDDHEVNKDKVGTYTIFYIVTDAVNNKSEIKRIVEVVDKTPPVITLKGEEIIILSQGETYKEFEAIATDNNDASVTIKIDDSAVDTSKVGQYEVIYTVEDEAGNRSEIKRIIKIEDKTPPVITLIGEDTITLKQGEPYKELGATTVDTNDLTVKIAIDSKKIDSNKVGHYEVIYTATDQAGNSHQVIRTVNVIDKTAPVIKLYGANPLIFSQGETYSEPGVTATDNNDVTIHVDIDSSAVDTNKVGEYDVIYTAIDSAINITSEIKRRVKVEDQTPPVITLNGPAVIPLAQGETYKEQGVTVTDNNDPKEKIKVIIDGKVDTNEVHIYELGYTATDSAGNTSQRITRIVNVVDKTAPVITLKGETSRTIYRGAIYKELGVTVTDNNDTAGKIKITIVGKVDTTTLGTFTLTYTATDQAGNSHHVIRTIKVIEKETEIDQIPPVITLNGEASITVDQGGTYTDLGITATDNNDSVEEIKMSMAVAVNTAILGTYTVTYTATDQAGNIATATRTVTVIEAITEIVINNTELLACLEENIGHTPSQIELRQLTYLSCEGRGFTDEEVVEIAQLTALTTLDLPTEDGVEQYSYISNLAFLKPLNQLKSLNLKGNRIIDIFHLSSLIQLEYLNLRGNKINDISPLKYLKQLKHLDINNSSMGSNTGVSTISPLSSLTKLEYLDLGSNKISDISPLNSLTKLNYLDLDSNNISDISPLSSLIKLEYLDLGINKISDISYLRYLTQLKNITLNDNYLISDISYIHYLTQLKHLNIRGIGISDISFLKNLTKLTYLDLYDNKINNISLLEYLNKLTNLNLTFNQIIDISPLKNLTQLTSLYLDENQINNISPLKDLIELTTLKLSSNEIINISPLKNLTKLINIGLSYNEIIDISALSDLTHLQDIYIHRNKITNISPLSDLIQLNNLWLSYNQISDISHLTNLTLLQLLYLSSNCITNFGSITHVGYISGKNDQKSTCD
jgi:Leucine-rich repeat (LRR) protein/ribosomal protein S6